MKTTNQIAAGLLAMAMMTAGAAVAQYGPPQGPPPPPQGYGQDQGGGWEAPPPEFAAAQQRGYHDGIEGARKDFENHRPPNVNNRDEFRNPHFIPGPDRRDYRMGFRRGYQVGVQHMYGPGQR
jgi:ribosome modulation factor